MKQELYMFGAILMVMTVLSSLGGSIRYEENFYNEVFDLLDDSSVLPVDQKDLADNSDDVPGNDESLMNEELIQQVEEEVIQSVEEVAQEQEPVVVGGIEAYEEGQFALY